MITNECVHFTSVGLKASGRRLEAELLSLCPSGWQIHVCLRVCLCVCGQQQHTHSTWQTQPNPVLLWPAWGQPAADWLLRWVWPLDLHWPIYALSADKRFGSQFWWWNLLRPPWHRQLLSVCLSPPTCCVPAWEPNLRATPNVKTADSQLAARNVFLWVFFFHLFLFDEKVAMMWSLCPFFKKQRLCQIVYCLCSDPAKVLLLICLKECTVSGSVWERGFCLMPQPHWLLWLWLVFPSSEGPEPEPSCGWCLVLPSPAVHCGCHWPWAVSREPGSSLWNPDRGHCSCIMCRSVVTPQSPATIVQ